MMCFLSRRRAFYAGPLLAACLLLLPAAVPARADTHCLEGLASWYGATHPAKTAHGLRTANGEFFNRNALTAAHLTLPFNTIVRVRNLANDRDVLVRITDRGPFVNKRVVDVSRRAAQLLGMLDTGIAPVSMEIVGDAGSLPLNAGKGFYLLLAETRDAQEAHRTGAELQAKLKRRVRSFIDKSEDQAAYYLYTGPYESFRHAEKAFLQAEEQWDTLGVIEGPHLQLAPDKGSGQFTQLTPSHPAGAE